MMKQFDLQHSHRRLVIGQTGPTRNFGAWSCELPVSEFLRAAYSRRSPLGRTSWNWPKRRIRKCRGEISEQDLARCPRACVKILSAGTARANEAR
jgi:hypothetical protein